MSRRTGPLVVTLALAVLVAPPAVEAQQAVFVVRHAERLDESSDSPLSEAGQRRARTLASLLKDAGITVIYTSELQRTVKTAEPLATARQIEIKKVPQNDARDVEQLVAGLRTQHRQDTVLVVGHSNTMPAFIKALGHPEEIRIGRDEYDLMLVVIPRSEGRPVLLRLRF